MITVKYYADNDGREISLSVKGHAGQAPEGQDIICASASILTYTAAQYASREDCLEHLVQSPDIRMESGDALIRLKLDTASAFADTCKAFDVCLIGYRLLADNFPQYVELIIVD